MASPSHNEGRSLTSVPRVRRPFKSPVTSGTRSNESATHSHSTVTPPNVTEKAANLCESSTPKRWRSGFKPPARANSDVTSPSPAQLLKRRKIEPERDLSELEIQEKALDGQIGDLMGEGHRVEDLQLFVQALHDYNEIKDAAQMVLGRLAELEELPLRSLYKRYNVPDTSS